MKPSYSKIPFSLERKQIVDFLSIAKAKHTAYAVIDFDITGVRNDLRKVKRHFNKKASLTGYLIYSFAQAVAEDKSIQAYRMGNQTIIFDDVDVSTMVERTVQGVKLPVAYVIRKANEKSVFEISEELTEAKNKDSTNLMDDNETGIKKKVISVIKRVGFLRRFVLRRIFKNPFLKKEFNGTVGFSSMGMFSYNTKGWVIPMTPHVLTTMVGGVSENIALEKDNIIKKESVCITVSMDHDMLDGAQTARFLEQFRKHLAKGISIENEEN